MALCAQHRQGFQVPKMKKAAASKGNTDKLFESWMGQSKTLNSASDCKLEEIALEEMLSQLRLLEVELDRTKWKYDKIQRP